MVKSFGLAIGNKKISVYFLIKGYYSFFVEVMDHNNQLIFSQEFKTIDDFYKFYLTNFSSRVLLAKLELGKIVPTKEWITSKKDNLKFSEILKVFGI